MATECLPELYLKMQGAETEAYYNPRRVTNEIINTANSPGLFIEYFPGDLLVYFEYFIGT